MCSREFLVFIGDACRGLANSNEVQHDSLLRASVLQKFCLAHAGHLFTGETRGLSDVIQVVRNPRGGVA